MSATRTRTRGRMNALGLRALPLELHPRRSGAMAGEVAGRAGEGRWAREDGLRIALGGGVGSGKPGRTAKSELSP